MRHEKKLLVLDLVADLISLFVFAIAFELALSGSY
jgi:hypothetical protein